MNRSQKRTELHSFEESIGSIVDFLLNGKFEEAQSSIDIHLQTEPSKSKFSMLVAAMQDKDASILESRAVLRTMSEGLVIQGESGQIQKFNAAALKILSLTEDELLGRTSIDPRWKATKEDGTPYPGEDHPPMEALRKNEPVLNRIMGISVPDGTLKWIKINAIPFQGAVERKVTVTFTDITEMVLKQKELQKILEDFRSAQMTAKIGSWRYDLLNGHQVWSTEHYRIFEIPENQKPENLFRLYRERIHPEDRATLDLLLERALKSGEGFSYNHRVFLDGGSRIKHVRGIGHVMRDSSGSPVFLSGTCQDITELVALQEQNRFILEAMGIGIWKFNPISQELIWDDSMYKLFEVSAKDFSGHYQAWESSLSPEAKREAVEDLQLALIGKKAFNTTFEILTKSGNRKFLGGRGVVVRNENGDPTMMYGINWDRSSEIKKEMEINSQKQLLDSILENLPEMVFVKDYDDELRFKYFNQTGQKLLGIPGDQIIGKNDFDLFPSDQAESFCQRDREVFESKKVHYIKKELIQTKNGVRWLETYKVPTFKPDGAPSLLIGISRDITDQLRILEDLEVERAKSLQSAKLASLGEMSAGIAHEINNPLAVISGTLLLLSKYREDATKFNSKIQILSKSTERIEKIVRGLKKFSRSSTGSVFKLESLEPLILEALLLTETKLKKHGVSIVTEFGANLLIECDAVEIEQVLINLINNSVDAIKSLSDRNITIKTFKDGDRVFLQIFDSGPTISPEIESKLFQPFFTTKPVGEGTGLGLSIAKGIIDNHKASISLNRNSVFTCFEISFQSPRAGGGYRAA